MPRQNKLPQSKPKGDVYNVYSDDENSTEEKFFKKFAHVGRAEQEEDSISDFEDESIDEDEAFNEEDYLKYGDLNFGNKRKVSGICTRISHKQLEDRGQS